MPRSFRRYCLKGTVTLVCNTIFMVFVTPSGWKTFSNLWHRATHHAIKQEFKNIKRQLSSLKSSYMSPPSWAVSLRNEVVGDGEQAGSERGREMSADWAGWVVGVGRKQWVAYNDDICLPVLWDHSSTDSNWLSRTATFLTEGNLRDTGFKWQQTIGRKLRNKKANH